MDNACCCAGSPCRADGRLNACELPMAMADSPGVSGKRNPTAEPPRNVGWRQSTQGCGWWELEGRQQSSAEVTQSSRQCQAVLRGRGLPGLKAGVGLNQTQHFATRSLPVVPCSGPHLYIVQQLLHSLRYF